ncbi:21951_t:CDS:2, partial [Gigaspora rosea]
GSFDKAKVWVRELQRQANPDIVGNKIDLIPSYEEEISKQVSTEWAKAYAFETGLLFLETSAKNGERVLDVFEELYAAFFLGNYLFKGQDDEKEKAFKYFKQVAELDHVIGINFLGKCYRNGIGTEKKFKYVKSLVSK